MKDVKITPPNISPETMKSMGEFFLKTSVPRIIEKIRKEEAEKEGQTLCNTNSIEDKQNRCGYERTEEDVWKGMKLMGVSEEDIASAKRSLLKKSVPEFIEKKSKEEARRRALDNNQDGGKRAPMRRIRGAKELVKYLESIDCPMSESTIYKLLREKRIPSIRPSDRILLFDLDAIDKWLTMDDSEKK